MPESGRWRFDNPLNQFYTKKQQKDPDLLLDTITEVPGPPKQVEDDPPEKNADEGLAYNFHVPDPIPVAVIPSPVHTYRNFSAHGYSTTCMDGLAKQLLNANDSRIAAIIRNAGGTGNPIIYIGSTADEARADGYPLSNGQTLTIKGTGAIWGIVKTGNETDIGSIGVFVEYAWVIG